MMGVASVETIHTFTIFNVNHPDLTIFMVKKFYITFLHRKSLGHEGPDREQGTQGFHQKKAPRRPEHLETHRNSIIKLLLLEIYCQSACCAGLTAR
jgi:hypothetical protein